MVAEYSADFRSAMDGLTSAVEYALSKFREQDSDLKSNAEVQQQGAKLRQVNRLIHQMHDSVFPEAQLATCRVCHKSMYVEKAFWQGTCWECASAHSN